MAGGKPTATMPSLAVIAGKVRQEIMACTTHAEIQACRQWATRLYDEHGADFKSYYKMLMRDAGEMQAANSAAHKLVRSVPGLTNHK